jgi:hypothetical protein
MVLILLLAAAYSSWSHQRSAAAAEPPPPGQQGEAIAGVSIHRRPAGGVLLKGKNKKARFRGALLTHIDPANYQVGKKY